ncbi:MAG: 3-phosphoshikimate 1-carboxyvinyltransferase [Gammaproteobacteria bacterium]|nr:3-phosphoshikimate 1-carboxyvinyltransferase [Gammaproteobacteria bacterium]
MNRQIFPFSENRISAELADDCICVDLPGSKYIANRILPMAALAQTPSSISNIVDNDDINIAIKGLSALGYQFEQNNDVIKVTPRENPLSAPCSLNTGHSGTFSRFITAIAAIESQDVTINCSEKMATRPMKPLFDVLRQMSADISSDNERLPATITGGLRGGEFEVDASQSSQYLSALLIVAPLLKEDTVFKIAGEVVSKNYVDMTLNLQNKMGIIIEQGDNHYIIRGGQTYQGIEYAIPADPVSSSYMMAYAVIAKQKVRIKNYDFDSVQGEAQFYQVLEQMGVGVSREANDLLIDGRCNLYGVEVELSNMPDVAQTLAVIACFADGVTKITNVEHLAYKESNRIVDTAEELRKTGIQVEYGSDYLTVYGGNPKGATLDTHDDHRMAMSLALLGIKVEGIIINNAEVVSKSFPTYWDLLETVGIGSKIV